MFRDSLATAAAQPREHFARDRGAAGGLFTTAAHYAKFLLAVAQEDARIMPAGLLERILDEPGDQYRLGWQLLEDETHGTILSHNGWAFGSATTGGIAPATGRGFVGVTNAAEGFGGIDTPVVVVRPAALACGRAPPKPRRFVVQRVSFRALRRLAVATATVTRMTHNLSAARAVAAGFPCCRGWSEPAGL